MLQNALLHIANSKDAQLIYQSLKFSAYQLGVRSYEIVETLTKMQCQNQRLAFCLPNSPELLCWYLACIHLGITIIPLQFEHNAQFIEKALQLTEPFCLFTNSLKKRDLGDIRLPKQCKMEIIDDTYKALYKHIEQQTNLIFNPERDLSKVDPKTLAMIIFSSSSEGELKGIMHSYQSAYAFIDMLSDVQSAKEHPLYVVAESLGQMGGITNTLLTLLKNGTVVLLDHFEVRDYLETLSQYKPTHIDLRKPFFYNILNYPNLDKKGFDRILTCFVGCDEISPELPAQLHEKTGAPIQTGYGLAETGFVTINRTAWLKNPGSCGQKIPFASIDLKDEGNGYVRIGEVGEIWIKSPALSLGYWNMPELTQTMFVNGWFKTGDLAMLDKEGYYWFKGKKTEIIHRDQHFIYPQTIEQILLKCPDVKIAAVVATPDPNEGEVPIAFVELKERITEIKVNGNSIKEKLLKHCKDELLLYQQPKELYILDKLPLNQTGKIDKKVLQKMVQK